MKKISVLIEVSIFGLVVISESFAQRGTKWKRSGGWGPGSRYDVMYDPKNVETISGEVVSVDKIIQMKGMSYGVHLTLKTEKETISMHLGPGWHIENQDVMIMSKNKVEVTGSRITFQGEAAIIAAVVKKWDEVLRLRDENGSPVWASWRKVN